MRKFTGKRAKEEHDKRQNNFTETDLAKVLSKSDRLKSMFLKNARLNSYFEEFKLLLSMLKDYYNRKYKTVPWYFVSSIGATLLYVLTPIDLIPDFIPFVGFIDDAAILGISLSLVRNEIEKYRAWKQNN